jgi:excisionase family DNA binding protein
MATLLDRPFIPNKAEAAQAKRSLEQLQGDKSNTHFILGAQSGQQAAIPESVFKLVVGLLAEISQGHAVIVMPMRAELTTVEAAEFLSVSRPHLIKMLEQGALDYRMVGRHRRLLFEDLLKYKEKTKRKRLKAIAEITAEDDALFGLR